MHDLFNLVGIGDSGKKIGNLAADIIKYNKDPLEAFAEAGSNTLVSTFTPNLLRSIAQGLDDRPRHVNREDGFWPMVSDDIKSRILWLRETLPGSVSPAGEEKTYPGSDLGHFLNATVNPASLTTYDQTEQSQEWERLMEATGRTDFYPSSSIPKEISGNGISKELSFEERQDFQRQRGGYLMLTAADMLGNPLYRAASDQGKAQLMADVRTYAHERAKADVLGDDAVDSWVRGLGELQQKSGVDTATYLACRRMYLDADDDAGADYRGITRDALWRDTRLTADQKSAIDDLLISDVMPIKKDVNPDYGTSDADIFIVSQMSDSARAHFDGVRKAAPGIDAARYQEIWKIWTHTGTKEDPYDEGDKRNDLMDMGFSRQDASRIIAECKKDMK